MDVAIVRHEPRRLGPLGLRELLEPKIRRVVAELARTPAEWLHADVSFAGDLAFDRADLTELVIAVERATGVSLTEAAIDRIGTYDDLVDAVVDARAGGRRPVLPSVFLRATIVPGRRDRRGVVAHSGWLSPYVKDTIFAEAVRGGRGTRLDVTVPGSAPLATVERIEACFAPLAMHGVTVAVQHARLSRGRAVA
jgi:acyl carrier protein